VLRETAERSPLVSTLRAVGATDGQIRLRAARDAALSSVPGILLGLALTPAAFLVAGYWDLPHAFGHRISPSLGFEVPLRLAALFMLLAALAALATLREPAREAATRPTRPLSEWAK
jgi:ABC-type antimicrobial peptide transport system permease subunit